MRDVWRPERRNRNIGTSSSGFSKANDMRIPHSWKDKHGHYSFFFERLDADYKQELNLKGNRLRILYERPRDGFTYGCSPADVIKMLTSIVNHTPSLPNIVAFRQPTRKQQQLKPVWGRFVYFAEFGKIQGTAIILEAQELGATLKWPKRMSLADQAEYERLVSDGHSFEELKRHYKCSLTEHTVRNTVLYRTLLHELGHLVQYHQEVLMRPMALDQDQDVARELYFSKPSSEREVFAHAFASELYQTLESSGHVPFQSLGFE
ncbi:MAG: hypothetical protein AAGF81_16905 [Pseudomonadota bacterium]